MPIRASAPPTHSRGWIAKRNVAGKRAARRNFDIVVIGGLRKTVKPTVDAIISGARTGEIGDGKIFILDLAECIRIRTGETGGEAIG